MTPRKARALHNESKYKHGELPDSQTGSAARIQGVTAAQVLSVPESHQETRAQHHLPERLTCSSQRCRTSPRGGGRPSSQEAGQAGGPAHQVRMPPEQGFLQHQHTADWPGAGRMQTCGSVRPHGVDWTGRQGPQALDATLAGAVAPLAATQVSPTLPHAPHGDPTGGTLPSWLGPPQQEAQEAPGSPTGSVPGGEGCCLHRALTAGGGGGWHSWAGLAPFYP